jgi:STE24 endopeptidase
MPDDRPLVGLNLGVGLFLGVFLLLVLAMGLWGRMLARHVRAHDLHRSIARFNRMMLVARMAIPAWFAVGLFALGWGWAVRLAMGSANAWPVELPAVLLGTLPAFLAWMGLWWSQYPADRALREQSLLIQLDQNLPIHRPPGFWTYLGAHLRLQLLFTIVPVLLILLARDIVAVALRQFELTRDIAPHLEGGMMIAAALGVFVIAPEILKRVLHTQPLPASPLRRRLENLCRRNGLRYRDILLWHTENNMGNAAVMGIIPRVRYILLSDLLLETMTDEQIEAVFAHEVGHIVHRHMSWYVVFIAILMLLLAGPGMLIGQWITTASLPAWLPPELLLTLLGAGFFLIVFGSLSRRFERQADVFAARSIQANQDPGPARNPFNPATTPSPDPQPAAANPGSAIQTPQFAVPNLPVTPHGAAVFTSALQRVAAVNNIPLSARSWCHGSIATRIAHLRSLSHDAGATASFDRAMQRVYAVLLGGLILFGGWVAIDAYREPQQSRANPTPASLSR